MSRYLVGRLKSMLRQGFGGVQAYLTEDDVVRQTGASPENLREWERRGLLRPYASPGRNLYKPEQVGVVHWLLEEERSRRRRPVPMAQGPDGRDPEVVFRPPS
jgi:MerR-like DNA binding protein